MEVRLCHPSDFKGFYEYNQETDAFQGTAEPFVTDSISLFLQGLRKLAINATLLIQPNLGVGSLDPVSGSYDGCIGHIQANESDMILQLFEYPVAADNLQEGIIIYDTVLTIASAYVKVEAVSTAQITRSFDSFSLGIWSTIILLIGIISVLLRIRNGLALRSRLVRDYSLSYTITHCLRLHHMPDTGPTRKLLSASGSVFALVVVHYFLTLIKTELVVSKDPILFNSYQDIIDRRAMPMFVKGMGYDEFFKKKGIPHSRETLWQYAVTKFDPSDMYIHLDQLAFLLGAVTVLEQKAVFIIEDALIPIIQASGCPLRARNPDDYIKVLNMINEEEGATRLANLASLTEEQKEAVLNHARKNHQAYTSVPPFLFHHSVDPSEKSFSQGLVLNPQSNMRLLHAISYIARRVIETGLTQHVLELAQGFDILGSYELLKIAAGPELKSRKDFVSECMSQTIVRAQAGFHPLMASNYLSLFMISACMLVISMLVLIRELITDIKVKAKVKSVRRSRK